MAKIFEIKVKVPTDNAYIKETKVFQVEVETENRKYVLGQHSFMSDYSQSELDLGFKEFAMDKLRDLLYGECSDIEVIGEQDE